MALTVETLAAAMRLESPVQEPVRSVVARLLAVGTAWVENRAPAAPDEIKEEAIIRMSAWCYDSPHWQRHLGSASAWRSSGAAGLVSPWTALDGVAVDA